MKLIYIYIYIYIYIIVINNVCVINKTISTGTTQIVHLNNVI